MSYTPGPWKLVETPHENIVSSWDVFIGEDQRVSVFPYKRIWSDDRTQSGLVKDDERMANARLIAAAPELLEALTMGAELNTPDFLDWAAARLINYGDNPNADFILSLRERAKAGRAAIQKAEGKP